MHTTIVKLEEAGHAAGPQCRCAECGKLKITEDKWIMRLGTFEGKGVNDRNEIKSKCRVFCVGKPDVATTTVESVVSGFPSWLT
jgi:hypothetical protein